MDKESRNAFMVVGAVLVALLAIALIFSGSPDDAVIGDAPVVAHAEGEEAGAEATAEAPAAVEGAEDAATANPEMAQDHRETSAEDVTDVTGVGTTSEGAEAEEQAAVQPAQPAEQQAAAPAEQEADGAEQEGAEAEQQAGDAGQEVAAADEAATEAHAALAGDPEAGERVFRQCQACHQVGEGAENRVGPMLNGVVGRQIASLEGFTYSDSLQALGQEGREWTPEELRGFLANPREYVPGTAMAYAGVRSEDDLENLIAYLGTFE